MAEASFNGIWKVVTDYSLQPSYVEESAGFVGSLFKLDDNGEVSWTIPDGIEPLPFCNCESYEVSQVEAPSRFLLRLYGLYPDHMFEFEVIVDGDSMKMTLEGTYTFSCQKVGTSENDDREPYSLHGALIDDNFSDLRILASTGKEFPVHRTIIALTQADDKGSDLTRLLHGQSENVITTVLHYLYCESLPVGLSEETAKACINAVKSAACLRDFLQLCDSFLQNTALKQQIMQLVNEMDACAEKVINIISGRGTDASSRVSLDNSSSFGDACSVKTGDGGISGESLISNPAKLWYALTQICREIVIASGKFLVVCDLFARRRAELPREERHDIMKCCHECIPKFLSRFKRFLEVCHQQLSTITATQRQDIAMYLVPEAESTLDFLATCVSQLSLLLDNIIKSSSNEKSDKSDPRKASVAEIGRALRNALHIRELAKLKKLSEKAGQGLQTLIKKRTSFNKMSHELKVQTINETLEKVIDQIPAAMSRFDSLIKFFNERISWKDWKYLFKISSSKVAFILNKMQVHRRELTPLIDRLIDKVQRDQFKETLLLLGLKEYEQNEERRVSHNLCEPVITKYARLTAVESLCKSPYPANSKLSKAAARLLKSGYLADLEFEIQDNDADTVIDHCEGASAIEIGSLKSRRISAHRIIMATRCTWFKRALLSGMRESIDRVITVRDTDIKSFQLFLQFIYTGLLPLSELSIAEIAELVQLADRYEVDSLKRLCEKSLEENIDEGTALYLLSLADQCQVNVMKKNVLEFIALHPQVTQSEDFCRLSSSLQTEVIDTMSSLPNDVNHRGRFRDSSTSSDSDVDEMIKKLEMGERYSVSDDELNQPEDLEQLEQCVCELRAVLGEEPSREQLVQIARAADYDANRALNFFFASSYS